MRRLLLCVVVVCALCAQAQLRIDINNTGRNPAEGTEDGYQPWTFGRVPSAEGKFAYGESDSVKITISSVEGYDGNAVRTDYWKSGVVDLFYKLLADGSTVGYMSGNGNDFDPITIAKGYTKGGGIQLVVEGLPAGDHSLLTYHNTTDVYNGNLAPIDVLVDGKTVSTGNKQTCRATKVSESGYSYILFSTEADKPVTIQFIARPAEDVTYEYIGVAVNAFVFDEPNPITMAADPVPTNLDAHVDADDGTARLCWKAAEVAVKHHVMVGTSKDNLHEMAVLTDTTYVLNDLYSLNTYYWRIDEEDAEGQVHEGQIWSFQPRHLAFPGAEGYGRYASGGRGGDVYHVTSLADEKVPSPGTLRYGLETATGPRTIVFDIGGVITLQSKLTNSKANVTIAGQTAPGRGIMMRSKSFGMASEGITRFLRLRLGGADDWDGVSPNNNTMDGMGMTGNNHSIMDHCSISWTIDEGFSSRNAKNLTLQRTLISEALCYAGHATQYDRHGYHVQHGYAATIGGETGSYHHNLLAHNQGRNWSMGGGLNGAGVLAGKLDMFNNVCYNWWDRTTDGGTHEAHFVNNYYKMGPDTKLSKLFSMDHEGVGTGTQRGYVNGNIRENKNGTKSQDKLNDTYVTNGSVDYATFVDEPFYESYATIHSAEEAFKNVLSDVGCNSPELDNHDIRMIKETLNGTTSTIGWHSQLRGIIDRESESEGFNGLNVYEATRPSNWDTDQDGMPDWWEDMTGSDKNTADNNADPDHDGYTLLEDYLNWLAECHRIVEPNTQIAIDLKSLFAGFANSPSYQSEKLSGTATASIDGETMTISTSNEGLSAFDVTVTDAEGTSMTRRVNIAVTTAETTGINAVHNENVINDDKIYTLSGRRVSSPVKGVNIINSKKVLKK
ncbi:MAG: hypothetical protein J5957_10760 [Prevotella sp.]|nr:hypothetical protein [Prevotella sp.]